MERRGRWTGLALGAAISLAVAGTAALGAAGAGAWPFAAGSGAGFAAVLLPLGWALGRQFDRVKAKSERDALTGAFNRRFMERCFEKLSEQARRGKKKISVTMIDVNDFKTINDGYGHRTGDLVLVKLSEALRECFACGEIVGRWGGDEFLLLCPYADRGASSALQRRIEEQMERLSRSEDKPISVAIGTAVFPDEGATLDQLLHVADLFMYADKNDRKKELPALQLLNA